MKIRDMTVGNEKRIIISFCVPLVIACICQQLYSIADGVVIGRFISDDHAVAEASLAAVGISTPVTLVLIAVATGLSVGLTVLVSQLFGGGNRKEIRPAVFTGMMTSLTVGTVLALLCFLFSDTVFSVLNTSPELHGDAETYLLVYLTGTPFVYAYYVCIAVFSSLGDSGTSLWLTIASSVTNILLDLLFVPVFGLGVGGAALATVITQALTCAASVALLINRVRRVSERESGIRLWSSSLFKRLSRLSVPSVIQQSAVAAGNFVIQSVVNDSGSAAEIAGFFAGLKVNSLAVTSFRTIGDGISAFTAQNFGAHKHDRLERGLRAGFGLVLWLVVPVTAVYVAFAPSIINIFLSEKSSVAISTGAYFIRCVSLFYALIVAKVLVDGVFRGLGKMKLFMASTLLGLFLRAGLVCVIAPYAGLKSIGYAWDIGWVAATVVAALMYLRVRKQLGLKIGKQ